MYWIMQSAPKKKKILLISKHVQYSKVLSRLLSRNKLGGTTYMHSSMDIFLLIWFGKEEGGEEEEEEADTGRKVLSTGNRFE